jgi:hypothetical protein
MQFTTIRYSRFATVAATLAALALWPAIGAAQEVSGRATAVRSTVLGVTSTLADTGALSGVDDARGAMALTAGIPMLGSANVLNASTISSIWDHDATDYVASEASLGGLNLGVSGVSVSADFVMARAQTLTSGASTGSSQLANLRVNGMPITATGAPNQTVNLLGGKVVLNEQQASAGGMVVNALHIVVYGVADVVIASASSGVGAASQPAPSPLPPLPKLF